MLNNQTVQDPFSKEDYVTRYAYDVSNRVEYVGYARPGTATDVAKWQILKYTYDGAGLVTSQLFAQGSHDYSYVWDNRATYDYS